MNRQEKQAIITSVRKGFSESQASFIVGVKGLTVNEMQKLRKKVRQGGGSVSVIKNTLLEKAVSEMQGGARDLAPYFEKQIAVVFAPQDFTVIARAIYETAREHENLKVVAGCYEGALVTAEKINYFATLPPREQLIIQHIASLKMMLLRLVLVVKQASEKGQPQQQQEVAENVG
jgi:large subunit ribosomal protein L10